MRILCENLCVLCGKKINRKDFRKGYAKRNYIYVKVKFSSKTISITNLFTATFTASGNFANTRSNYLLEKIFNTLIESYIDNNVGIAENFLSKSLASGLKNNLNALYADNQMQAAGTGNEEVVSHNKSVRSDIIYWLDRKHDNKNENDFFDLMDLFVSHLNETCYSGINGYEFHYALYEKGSSYKKHIDQFKTNKSRQYSLIMYLNEDWQISDGGELCIHHEDRLQHITPENGKIVFFKSSELAHEVLLSHKPRMSITGWLKTDQV